MSSAESSSVRCIPGSCARALRLRSGVLSFAGLVSLVLGAAMGCAAAPEPPPTPQAVVQLSQRYERLTASMDAATARDLIDRRLPQYAALEALKSLAFLRDVIADATSPETEDAAQTFDVQGSLEVHAPCPGWDADEGSDEAGFIELVIGVDASRVQRAFTGRAENCRFVAKHSGHKENVTASMELELDLGHSLGLGEPVPALLIRAEEVSAELSDSVGELQLGEPSEVLSLRVVDAERLEMLIELDSLDIDRHGSFLLALREDGRVGVRGRDGEWVCGRKRGDPCVPAD
jgi:hypothetical protein